LGSAYFSAAKVFSGPDSLPVLIIAASATAGLSVLIAKSDWVLAVEIFRNRGLRGVVVNARRIILPRKTSGENNH